MRSGNIIDGFLRNEFGLWLKYLGKVRHGYKFIGIGARIGTEAECPEDAESERVFGRRLHFLRTPSPVISGEVLPPFRGYVLASYEARVRRSGKSEPP
jgi:hypothetical protein